MPLSRRKSIWLRFASLILAGACCHRILQELDDFDFLSDQRRMDLHTADEILDSQAQNQLDQEYRIFEKTGSDMLMDRQSHGDASTIEDSSAIPNTEAPVRKRQRRRRNKGFNPDEPTTPSVPLKVSFPIFVPSLPKSGTTSIHSYFKCGGHKSAHHVYRIDGKLRNKIGKCVERNVQQSNPSFEGCGDYNVWTDTGYVGLYHKYKNNNNQLLNSKPMKCYYPLIESLEDIYQHYPNATFLFVLRNQQDWLHSIQTYHDGFIMDAWRQCQIDGFPQANATVADFGAFYQWHQSLIRNFVKKHPSLTYIEIPLEADNTAQMLQDQIGIPQTCWGHYNKLRQKKHLRTGDE